MRGTVRLSAHRRAIAGSGLAARLRSEPPSRYPIVHAVHHSRASPVERRRVPHGRGCPTRRPVDPPVEPHQRLAAWTVGGRRSHRVGERREGDGRAHHGRRRELACRFGPGGWGAGLSVRARALPPGGAHRRHRRAHLSHDRWRGDLVAAIPGQRYVGLPRRHRLLGRPARHGVRRSDERPLLPAGHPRRRRHLARAADRRTPGRGAG